MSQPLPSAPASLKYFPHRYNERQTSVFFHFRGLFFLIPPSLPAPGWICPIMPQGFHSSAVPKILAEPSDAHTVSSLILNLIRICHPDELLRRCMLSLAYGKADGVGVGAIADWRLPLYAWRPGRVHGLGCISLLGLIAACHYSNICTVLQFGFWR